MENISNPTQTIHTNHDNIHHDNKEANRITLNEAEEPNNKNEIENNNSSNITSNSSSSSTNSNTETTVNTNNNNNNNNINNKETINSEINPTSTDEHLSEEVIEANITDDQENHSETNNSSHEDSVANASTEVNPDISISERLAGLSIESEAHGDSPNNHSTPFHSPSDDTSTGEAARCDANPEKQEKSAELTRSILAGEVSDNSECSVDVDGDEDTNYDDDKAGNGDASDEEMFIEDQDEEVEEEEEFHEVEEEKHKTSQESVGSDKTPSSPPLMVKSPAHLANSSKSIPSHDKLEEKTNVEQTNLTKVVQEPTESMGEAEGEAESKSDATKNTDWADIMLSSNQDGDRLEEKVDDGKTSVEGATKDIGEAGDDAGEKKKELDLDEDVKNPQYIPKKGVFYEHDDRSHDANSKKQPSTSVKKDEEIVETKESTSSKKSGTQERTTENRRGNRRQRTENDRWNHDLYKDEKQKPKSKSELITAYGYDIRQERTYRNHSDNRPQRAPNNNNNSERQHSGQDNQRSRQLRDNRTPRQNQPLNRSKERRPRRQTNRNRSDAMGGSSTKREEPRLNNRIVKPEIKDAKTDVVDSKQVFQMPQTQTSLPPNRRDQQDGVRDRNIRNENRGRRQNSKDRPPSNSVDDKLPPINTVMPPITTWSNKIEDMVKEEASRKESPSRQNNQNPQGMNSLKGRPNDYWPQNQPNKGVYHERPVRNSEDSRHQQHYNSRRYQERDEVHKTQFVNRNHYNDRVNPHHQEWRRTNHYSSSYAKPSEFEPIKTQTFENSRLAQTNINRFNNFRDARDIINERRMQGHQQNFQAKVPQTLPGPDHHQQQQQRQLQHQQQQLVQQQQQQILHHQHLLQQHQQQQSQPQTQQQQASQHIRQHQAAASQQHPIQNQAQQQPPQQSSQTPQIANQQLQNHRQHQPHQANQPQQPRHNLVINNIAEGVQESARLNVSTSNANDPINSRPIIKTDAYTGANVAPHSQQTQPLQQQHSQNHRSLGGQMSQQGPSSAGSHLVPSHLNAGGTQAQYYTPSSSSRDSAAAAAALATAYHGYIPSGHSVMDAPRYHMTSQQLSDHGYLASPGQTNDVATASVLQQQGMYTDAASAGGTVASSAYLAQAGSTLSPSTNIPVTGAGPPPIAPVSYLQHSQYAHPPYSNPYPQPQHNQAPPQSSHPYSPYWTYI